MFTGTLCLTPKPYSVPRSLPALINGEINRRALGRGLKDMGTELVQLLAEL